MSSTATTGFCRVTVVAPDSRIDVALPDDIAVADVYPEILRLTGQTQLPGTPTGYHLLRRDGTVLDSALLLAAQRVLDGELLSLRPFADSLPPTVFDDVSDAVATAVTRDRHLWREDMLRGAGLVGGVLLIVLMPLVLWYADPDRHSTHGLPGIVAAVLLMALARVRARVYDDRPSAVALGLGAMPHLLVAGSGIIEPDPGADPGRLQFLFGCVCVLVASVLLVALTPDGDAPFVATIGTLATFCAIFADASATDAAAVCAPAAVGTLAFLPGLSTRFARLPIGYASPYSATSVDFDADPDDPPSPDPIDAERIAAQARRGHETLLGLVGGCSVVVIGAAMVLGFSDSVWGQVLALTTGLAMLLRARLFRYTSQVASVLVAGIAAIGLLVLGLALHTPATCGRSCWAATGPGWTCAPCGWCAPSPPERR